MSILLLHPPFASLFKAATALVLHGCSSIGRCDGILSIPSQFFVHLSLSSNDGKAAFVAIARRGSERQSKHRGIKLTSYFNGPNDPDNEIPRRSRRFGRFSRFGHFALKLLGMTISEYMSSRA
jgi:hypothetical protein